VGRTTAGEAILAGGASANGRTTAAMSWPPSGIGAYNDWSFANVWHRTEEGNDDYPFHRWQALRYTLRYAAAGNGSVEGDFEQVCIPGVSGTMVTALHDEGFQFQKWSDGSTENPRRDRKVVKDVNFSAIFVDADAVSGGLMIS
jgi:hypothetical protein